MGILAVVCGAFGAHALKPQLMAQGLVETWETAVLYHLAHAVSLLALAVAPLELRFARAIFLCWLFGIVLFSGSLYGLCLTDWSFLGPVTPLGGLLFIVGWALCAFGPRRHPSQ